MISNWNFWYEIRAKHFLFCTFGTKGMEEEDEICTSGRGGDKTMRCQLEAELKFVLAERKGRSQAAFDLGEILVWHSRPLRGCGHGVRYGGRGFVQDAVVNRE
jgi:hypothetical protein